MGALGLLAETLLFENDPSVAHRLAERINNEPSASIESSRTSLTFHASRRRLPTREPIPVVLIVADAIERIRVAAEQHDVKLDFVEPEANLVVVGDRRQLISAIHALLENAVVYSSRAASSASRSSHRGPVTDDGESVGPRLIAIKDQGVGIPAKDLERIFERFYRVDPGRARETGGTGLGLSIVRHVAQNHGGNVLVESREGEGSTFTSNFRCPTDGQETRQRQTSQHLARRGRGVIRRRATIGLDREGFDVAIARDGQQAMALFGAETFDLVLLDLMLPKMSGLDVCRQMRAISEVPIIIVSAKGEEVDMVLMLEIGATTTSRSPTDSANSSRASARCCGVEEPTRRAGVGRRDSTRTIRMDIDARRCYVNGEEIQTPKERVRPAATPARESRTGVDPRSTDRFGSGVVTTRRHQDPRRAHQAPANLDRGQSEEPRTHHDGARRRLSLRGYEVFG